MWLVHMCCSVLQCVAVCCSVLQCVMWLVDMCCMTRWCIWHDSLICVWHDTTHVQTVMSVTSFQKIRVRRHDSSCLSCHVTHINESCHTCQWLVHMCGMTHWYVWYDSLICVTWLVDTCGMTHWYVWHDSWTQVTWHDMTEYWSLWFHVTCVNELCHEPSRSKKDMAVYRWLVCYAWHFWLICDTWLVDMCDMTRQTWSLSYHGAHFRTLKKDMAVYQWLVCSAWYFSLMCVTRIIDTRGMTHWYVWHDSLICVTWLIDMCDTTRDRTLKPSCSRSRCAKKEVFVFCMRVFHVADSVWGVLHIQIIASILQHAATYYNTLQHPVTLKHVTAHCNTLPRAATHCNTLQLTGGAWLTMFDIRVLVVVTRCNTLQHASTPCNTLQHPATHHNTLHHAGSSRPMHLIYTFRNHCNTLNHATPWNTCNTLHHTAPHCTLLQHTATHCNTLQHTTRVLRLQTENVWYSCGIVVATSNKTLQHTGTHWNCNTLKHTAIHCTPLQHTTTHCKTLQRTTTHRMHPDDDAWCTRFSRRNTLQLSVCATHCICNTLKHTETHCNTLQHSATHCNTPEAPDWRCLIYVS